jgi:hypothetical protein
MKGDLAKLLTTTLPNHSLRCTAKPFPSFSKEFQRRKYHQMREGINTEFSAAAFLSPL